MATKPQHYHWQKKLPFLLSCGQHFAGILPLSQWLCRKSTTRFMSRRMRRHFSPVKRVSSLILRAKPWLAKKVWRHGNRFAARVRRRYIRRERSDHRKCVCFSQAILNAVAVKCIPPPFLIFSCRIQNPILHFSCGIQNPTNDWNPETSFQQQETCTWNVHGIRNPRREIQNLTVPWIPLHLGRRHRTSSPNEKMHSCSQI